VHLFGFIIRILDLFWFSVLNLKKISTPFLNPKSTVLVYRVFQKIRT